MSKKGEPQGQSIDLDGDGKADIIVQQVSDDAFDKAAAQVEAKKRAAAAPRKTTNAQPTTVDGGDAPRSDALEEFQAQKADKHFRIVIHSTAAPGEVKRIYVGVNGVPYTMTRDVEHIVPKCVLDALDIAVETRFRDGPKDELGNVTKIAYEVRSYPYQNLGEVEPTAISK